MVSPRQTTDKALIEACRQGEAAAWDELVTRYERLVYTVPLRYGLSPAEADDVFQQVWILLLEHLHTLKQPERVAAWLVTTARRECWNRRRGADFERTSSYAPDTLPENKWIAEASPEEIVTSYDRYRSLQAAWEQLKSRCRQLLWHLYQDPTDPSYADIAEKLDMPVGAIGPTRARCLQQLRQMFDE